MVSVLTHLFWPSNPRISTVGKLGHIPISDMKLGDSTLMFTPFGRPGVITASEGGPSTGPGVSPSGGGPSFFFHVYGSNHQIFFFFNDFSVILLLNLTDLT